jgi:hypothetical protein
MREEVAAGGTDRWWAVQYRCGSGVEEQVR